MGKKAILILILLQIVCAREMSFPVDVRNIPNRIGIVQDIWADDTHVRDIFQIDHRVIVSFWNNTVVEWYQDSMIQRLSTNLYNNNKNKNNKRFLIGFKFLSDDQKPKIAALFHNGLLQVMSYPEGNIDFSVQAHDSRPNGLEIVQINGEVKILTFANDKKIKQFDSITGQEEFVFEGHQGPVLTIAIIKIDGLQIMLSGGTDKTLVAWELESRSIAKTFKSFNSFIKVIVPSPLDQEVVFLGMGSGMIYKFNFLLGLFQKTLDSHYKDVDILKTGTMLLNGQKQNVLISGCWHGLITIFDLKTLEKQDQLKLHVTGIKNLLILDNQAIISSSKNGNILIWQHGQVQAINEQKDDL